MSAITTIVFDVGRVLYDFDHGISFTFLEKNGAVFERDGFFLRHKMDHYERGEVSSADFLHSIDSLFEQPIDRSQLLEGWQTIFTPIPAMLELVVKLKQNYKVLLLSNTNDLHWEHLAERYGIRELAHGYVASHEAGSRKPEDEIYLSAETRFNLTPAETVFVDDLPENIAAAKARGWKTILHRSYAETLSELVALGVITE